MKIVKSIILVFLLVTLSSYCNAANDTIYTKNDSLIYESCIKSLSEKSAPSIIDIAKQFLGKPYVASTLEIKEKEVLAINLRELDCTTFVETCVAIHLAMQSGDLSFSNYCKQLSDVRYRDGNITGYPSRLHYMTDWIYENQKNGILDNISLQLGGKTVDKQINYMTTHIDSYKYLKNNASNVNAMKLIEDKINSRHDYQVIPVNKITDAANGIKDGDIILFATNIGGLDYSHVGIAYHKADGQLSFIHASSKAKEVIIENKSLIDYCHSSKICSGISVLRLK
jgi:cell wall-associated NlpC family hydrolase